MEELISVGATEVVPEVLESSLVIVSHVLHMLGSPDEFIRQRINAVRSERYDLLHGMFYGEDEELWNEDGEQNELLQGVTLADKAWAVGKAVSELALAKNGTVLQRITRDGKTIDVTDNLRLEPGDVLVLKGTQQQVEHSESQLLRG